jgi:glycosyltransferase involved in cell wall biosynthesis
MLERITPVILTRDEEVNIGRVLGQLAWAGEVVVVDSLSNDSTVEIARSFPNVRVVQRPFDTLASQWTYAVAQSKTEWILMLDADYFVPAALASELETLVPPEEVAAYEDAFIYAIGGRPLRASLYPPRPVLLRRGRVEFWQDGHTQRVRLHGLVATLHTPILHDDRKSLRRFVQRQSVYMRQEAAKLRASSFASLNTAGRIRKLRVLAPFAALVYTLFIKRTLLDGRAGLHYAFERFLAEAILSLELFR